MLYIKLGAARVVDVSAVSVQRHRNVISNVPDAVYVFRVTAGSVTNGHHLFTAALQIGIAGLTTVIEPVVVDLLFLAFDTDHHGPSFMVVRGSAAVRQPRYQENG